MTTLTRGITPDELGSTVERLYGDRTDPAQMAEVLADREFDAVVDTIAMRPDETRSVLNLLDGRTGHYVHFSTGQVYLVREGRPAPARESDYDGPLMAEPGDAWGSREWWYGVDKRGCEDVLAAAWSERKFPYTSLRLPMIHGERDHYGRIHGTLLRMEDGGPIVVAEEPGAPLRHIDRVDLVAAIVRIVEERLAVGRAINLSQTESWTLERFFQTVARLAGVEPGVIARPRAALLEAGVFPACSPFSNPWMSVLDPTVAIEEWGLSFGGFETYLPRLVRYYLDRRPPPPVSYADVREAELALVG